MPSGPREPDTDLQRGFEPLRTIFAVLVLLLGFAASARAQTIPAAMPTRSIDGVTVACVVTRPSATARASGCADLPVATGVAR